MAAAGEIQSIPNPEAIRDATQKVLSRPEFGAPPGWEEFLFSLLNTIREWLKSIASWSAENPDLARILGIFLALISLAVLTHLLYLAFADLLPFRQRQEGRPIHSSRWEILEGAARNWGEALEIARRMLEAGNTRRAIWIAHRVMLGLLHEQGAIHFTGWKTNSHYLDECARNHPWYATFVELTALYEQAVYAQRVAQRSLAESLLLRIDQLSHELAT
jgi:hypothetical protein